MAVTIRWSAPEDSGWTYSRIYRASSKTGTYSLLDSVAIGTYSYTDSSGSSAYWYKVSFWDGVNESSLSEAVQGDVQPNYCSLSNLRKISNFSTAEISDADVIALMPIASRFAHKKVMTKHKLERDLIGPINGSNTIFYTRSKPIGDGDMDSDVDESDVSVFYATFDANRQISFGSAQTVSSVDARSGAITMSTAPTTTTAEAGLFITYYSTVEDLDYEGLRLAADFFLAHLCALKVRGESPNFEGITAPYLRQNVSGISGQAYDPWRFQHFKTGMEIINDLLGKGIDGIGFSRVDADSEDTPW